MKIIFSPFTQPTVINVMAKNNGCTVKIKERYLFEKN